MNKSAVYSSEEETYSAFVIAFSSAEEAPAEPAVQPEQSEEKPVEADETVNPVEAGPAVAPKDENGKFDVTKIAEASDFSGLEEESGCKS